MTNIFYQEKHFYAWNFLLSSKKSLFFLCFHRWENKEHRPFHQFWSHNQRRKKSFWLNLGNGSPVKKKKSSLAPHGFCRQDFDSKHASQDVGVELYYNALCIGKIISLSLNTQSTYTHSQLSCQWVMADSGVADCIMSAACRRCRRHHFISSRLSEWLLTGVLTLAPPQLASNQIRVSQGCGSPWAQQHHWRAGDGEGVDFIHDYIRVHSLSLTICWEMAEQAHDYQCEGCLFAWCVSGLTLAQSIWRCPSQTPTTKVMLSVPKVQSSVSLMKHIDVSYTVRRPQTYYLNTALITMIDVTEMQMIRNQCGDAAHPHSKVVKYQHFFTVFGVSYCSSETHHFLSRSNVILDPRIKCHSFTPVLGQRSLRSTTVCVLCETKS